MSELFSVRKRLIGLGLVGVLVLALAMLGSLWWVGQTASAQPQGGVALQHVNPDGSDYLGNPYCPDTIWIGGVPILGDPRDDCNNITSQMHVIRTVGWIPFFDPEGMTVQSWNIQNFSGAGAVPVAQDRCGDIAEVTSRPNWNPANDDEQCIVIHSSTPGETWVTLTYDECVVEELALAQQQAPECIIFTTDSVVKEWDSLVDTVILKPPAGWADGLPPDFDGDGDVDATDHHLADMQGTWENDPVIWDEVQKRIRSYPGPIQLMEIVHGEHDVLINAETVTLHHPTEGAIFQASILSDKGCTYFTDPLGGEDFGNVMNGISDWGGRFLGPHVAPPTTQPFWLSLFPFSHNGTSDQGDWDIQDIWVDTICEEQATILIWVGYPGQPGSLRVPEVEAIHINWVTTEMAKQPQIRWAGEEIVLEKRWAPPDYEGECPYEGFLVKYIKLDGPGGLVEGIPDIAAPSFDSEPESVWTTVNEDCISKAMYSSEDMGEVDVEALLYNQPPEGPEAGGLTQLGFLLDGSGSISAADWTLITSALAAAVSNPSLVPQDGSVEVTVVQFSNGLDTCTVGGTPVMAAVEVAPTVITAANAAQVAAAIAAIQQDAGTTPTADGIDCIADQMVNSPNFLQAARSIINIATDGAPNEARTLGSAVTDLCGGAAIDAYDDACLARDVAVTAGITEVDAEGISGADIGYLQELVWPQPGVIAPPFAPGFVIQVPTAAEFFDALRQKLEALLPDFKIINKHAFLVWYLKIYQVELTNVDGERTDHNAGVWKNDVTDTSTDTKEDTLNVSADTLLRVQVKGYFESTEKSGRPDMCVDMDGDGDEAGSEPGVPYQTTSHEGCVDPNDRVVPFGHWVLPDDLAALAGFDIPARLPTWDVMSDIDEEPLALLGGAGWGGYIGPKSTLDSHDNILRPFVPPCSDRDGNDIPYYPFCDRKTVDPDGELTEADAIMPVLKITAQIADPADAGFLKEADKFLDVDLDSLHWAYMIPYEPEIPPFVNNGGYDWDSWPCRLQNIGSTVDCPDDDLGLNLGPYWFYEVFNTMVAPADAEPLDITECEAGPAGVVGPLCNAHLGNQAGQSSGDPVHPRKFQFYTDNRGQGYFFANGDYNLSFDECVIQALFGAPDCDTGDVVGTSVITVTGDYPYFRKHPAVLSNPVVKTWTWGGFKDVTAERIDATHTAIIAHLKDRDGYCKYDVDLDDSIVEVLFSPSEHPVQGEEITFILNTEVGSIVSISPNALYSAPHVPLGEATVTGLQDGVLIDRSEAVALAEDVRVLDALGIRAMQDAIDDEECMAYVVIEHPADEDPDVSVYFHDPEGTVTRHWPPSELLVPLVAGWNDSCYVGPSTDVEDAVADLLGDLDQNGVIDLLAIYRYDPEDTADPWDSYFPGSCDIEGVCTIETLEPYDQLFVLMELSADWMQELTPAPSSADLVEGWNSICYAGANKGVEEATSNVIGDFAILYTLGSDQMWRRFVPGRADLTNIVNLNTYTSVFLLVTAEDVDGDGVVSTWIFDP